MARRAALHCGWCPPSAPKHEDRPEASASEQACQRNTPRRCTRVAAAPWKLSPAAPPGCACASSHKRAPGRPRRTGPKQPALVRVGPLPPPATPHVRHSCSCSVWRSRLGRGAPCVLAGA